MSVTSISSVMSFQDDQLYKTSQALGRYSASQAQFWSGSGNAVRAYQEASGSGSPLSVPNGHSHSHSLSNIEAVKRMVF